MRRNLSWFLIALTVGSLLMAVWLDEYRWKLIATSAVLLLATAFIGPPTIDTKEEEQ